VGALEAPAAIAAELARQDAYGIADAYFSRSDQPVGVTGAVLVFAGDLVIVCFTQIFFLPERAQTKETDFTRFVAPTLLQLALTKAACTGTLLAPTAKETSRAQEATYL
jgi:hypothetical protein